MVVKNNIKITEDVTTIEFTDFEVTEGVIDIPIGKKIHLTFAQSKALSMVINKFNTQQFIFYVEEDGKPGKIYITNRRFIKKLITLRIPQDGLTCDILRRGTGIDTEYKVRVV